jgi:signal transduction histidine kinase
VRYWNPAAERLFGLSAEAVLGKRAAAAVPGWPEVAEHAAGAADAVPSTVPITTPAGERWCSAIAIAFDDGCVYSLRDVTAERELERARSDFLATASHELRTPLAAVYGASRTLRRSDVGMSDDQREAFLEMIEREAERLRTVTNQLLVAGRLDADRLELAEDVVDVASVAETSLEAVRLAAPETIALELRAEESPLPARADHDMLRQVLANLLDNAVKYTERGTVKVVVGRDEDAAWCEVRDTGPGIPAEDLPRVFERFYRVDKARSREKGGTGLGLSIVKHAIALHGGEVSVVSRVGGGTRFRFEIPA